MAINSTAPATAWEAGRFDRHGGARQLLFGCMHEDVSIERRAFPPGGRVFCIASAGCTAIALAADHDVVAVDINPMQIEYVKRRLAGGPVEPGRAERFMAWVRRCAPVAGWNRQKLRTFLDLEDPAEQIRFWRARLDTRRFRTALDFVFAPAALHAIYSPRLLQALPANFGAVIRQRMVRCFSRYANRRNPYARMLLLGEPCATPARIRSDRIELACSDAAAFLEGQPAGSFDGLSLSNILDGANTAYAQQLIGAVQHAATPAALVVLRTFGEPQITSETNHAADDRSMLWGVVDVRPARSLRTTVCQF